MDMALFIPKGDTLVTYYILPLCGANKRTFGSAFRCSFISAKGYNVYVKLGKKLVTPHYKTDPQFRSELIIGDETYLIYQILKEHVHDLDKFREGKYSEMSKEAKKIIYQTSTLPFNKSSGSFKMSHPLLQALDRTKTLRKYLQDWMDFKPPIPDSYELMDKPSPDWYIESKMK